MEVTAALAILGGIASTAQLRSLGCTERALTRAARAGVARPRLGWYTQLPPTDPRYRAVEVGGRLTGASALNVLGAWMLRRPHILHVAVEPGTSRLRARQRDVRVHWVTPAVPAHSATMVGVADALLRVILDEPLETAVSCVDWALSTGRLDLIEYESLLLRLPRRARAIDRWVDGASQSVLESVARVRLKRRGWSTRSQVRVGDLDAIDIVIEDQVALELDGREFHADRFERDRAKDLQITLEGRHALRVSASMLRSSWPRVERAIEIALISRIRRAGDSAVPPPLPAGSRTSPRASWPNC